MSANTRTSRDCRAHTYFLLPFLSRQLSCFLRDHLLVTYSIHFVMRVLGGSPL